MKNRTSYLFAALGLVLLLAFLYWRDRASRGRFDWRDSWEKTAYNENSNQPYGTLALHRLLEGYFPKNKLTDIKSDLVREMPLDSSKRSSYVFVGEGLYLDSLSTEHLLAFVAAGNTALLSSKTIPFDLMFHLYYHECENAEWSDYAKHPKTHVRASLVTPPLGSTIPLHYARQNVPEKYFWSYIEPDFFCDSLPQRPLGYLNDSLVNFASFPHGKGSFLLHTTPIAFSNYHLLKADSRRYTERVLAYLPEGQIYWDSYSRVAEEVSRRRNRSAGRSLPTDHPLAYVLKNPPLAWAWYLLLGLAAAFLVFRARRRQRVIPVAGKNENSSYEFIGIIANLHFREKNYRYLCLQTMRLFLAHTRERYGLVAQLDPSTLRPRYDSQYEQRLALVSGVPLAQIQDIFAQYAASVRYEPTEDMAMGLYQSVEAFWRAHLMC
ncbi:MAG: DUF4350 domain-containing protein [Saprospiraceae bacterium]